MLPAKTLGAIAFVAVTGGIAYWQLGRTDDKLETAPPQAALPTFATGEITGITIAAPGAGAPVTAARHDGAWRLTSPVDDAADADNVKRAIEALGKARLSERPVAEAAASWPKLGLGHSEVVTVTLRAADADVVTLHVSADGKFARVGDAPASYQLFGLTRGLIDREVRMWRDRTITSFDPKAVATVAASAGGVTVRAKRIPAAPDPDAKTAPKPDGWELVDGSAVVGDALDPAIPMAVVQRMAVLKADDFATVPANAAGLAEPALTLEVTMEDGARHVLKVGAAEGDDTYVGIDGSDRVWKIRTQNLEYFAREPIQWRDKSIADLDPAAVMRIQLDSDKGRVIATREPAGAWKLSAPKGATPNAEALDKLASAMRNFRGAAIANGVSARDAGLTKPTVTATFSTGSDKVTVKLGTQLDNKTWYASASTRKDIVVLSQFAASKLQVGPKELTQ